LEEPANYTFGEREQSGIWVSYTEKQTEMDRGIEEGRQLNHKNEQ
jgi:hypothetical protein